MRNQNKPVKLLDDSIKSKEEIAAMIENMMSTDENGNPEKKEISKAV